MQFCNFTKMYVDKTHRIPLESVIEADQKLQEYNSTILLGSFLYGTHLINELKEKYKL